MEKYVYKRFLFSSDCKNLKIKHLQQKSIDRRRDTSEWESCNQQPELKWTNERCRDDVT